ncbi:acid phosphatase [Sphingobium sp. Ant17]|uniref:acid phosphatase n=1 Tax=Sphingobium sp. Ant17 TaxID=1461752 RepID=UPI0004B318B2|nr:phosphatase PAP2 family protein [Sphingobium sp. Ant17]
MKFATIIACLCLVALPCAAATPPASPPSRLGSGYLKDAALAADFSPPPPAPGSAAQARDDEAAKAALLLRDSPHWALAAADAELFGPTATAAFSCTVGVAIDPATTPRLDKPLRRTIADFGRSTSKIKQRYTRPRPFMVNGLATCTPDMETVLRKDGSYPSGYNAIGYGWGLILSQLRPDLASTLVARGRAFGDGRRICNAHWLSDTEEGRLAASATLARLNAEPAFQKDMKARAPNWGVPRLRPLAATRKLLP